MSRNFKGFSLICAIAVVLFLSCRKRMPIDVLTEDEYNPPIEHCFNGYKDSNELGPDCGGDCEACQEYIPPCTSKTDTFDIHNVSLDEYVISKTSGVGGAYVYRAYYSATDYYEFYFYELPTVTTIYSTCGHWYPDNSEEVRVQKYVQGGSTYYGFGSVYVNYHNDGFRFTGCDMAIGKIGYPPAYNMTFNVTFE